MQINDSQIQCYGKKMRFSVNVPTRWATNYFVVKDLEASQQAYALAVCKPEWGKLGTDNYSDQFRQLVLDNSFWDKMRRLIELLKPFSDAIHQLEADQHMLSMPSCHRRAEAACAWLGCEAPI